VDNVHLNVGIFWPVSETT